MTIQYVAIPAFTPITILFIHAEGLISRRLRRGMLIHRSGFQKLNSMPPRNIDTLHKSRYKSLSFQNPAYVD